MSKTAKLNPIMTIGTDPEFMLLDSTNKIVSAIPVFKAGKENKIKKDGVEFYYDNVLGETNTPPSHTKKDFLNSIKNTFGTINGFLNGKYNITMQASHTFDRVECDHPDACVFGCNPEYDAYAVEQVHPPECTSTFRSAGGHIHIGRSDYKDFENDQDGIPLIHYISKMAVIKLMDATIGLSLAIIDNDPTSPARKQLYGNAGRHRPTDYGVEYRTPSNYWLRHPDTASLIYDLTEFCFQNGMKGTEQTDYLLHSVDSDRIVEAVNNNNRDLAKQLIFGVGLPKELLKRVLDMEKVQFDPLFAKAWGI